VLSTASLSKEKIEIAGANLVHAAIVWGSRAECCCNSFLEARLSVALPPSQRPTGITESQAIAARTDLQGFRVRILHINTADTLQATGLALRSNILA